MRTLSILLILLMLSGCVTSTLYSLNGTRPAADYETDAKICGVIREQWIVMPLILAPVYMAIGIANELRVRRCMARLGWDALEPSEATQ